MLTKSGFNVIDIPDKGEMMRTLGQIRPPAALFYSDETAFATQVKQTFPEMEVIIRFWPDDEAHKQYTPQQFLSVHAAESRRGLVLYTNNESGLGDEVINWNIEVAQKAVEFGRSIVCLNPSAGSYDLADLPRLRPLLELAGLNPHIITLGLHAYAGGVIVSGMFKPEDLDANVSPLKWPKGKPLDDLFPFHIGRQRMITGYCQRNGIKLPRIAYTETGFDWTSDISKWLGSRIRTPGYDSIDGWKSLVEQWKIWWPQWTPEMAYIKQFQYAEEHLMKDVVWALHYCYGTDGNPRWLPFRVDNSKIVTYMEGQPQMDITPPVPAPVIPPVASPPIVIAVPVPVEVVTPAPVVMPTVEIPTPKPPTSKLVASVEGTEATVNALKAILDGYNALAKLNNLPVLTIQVQ